MIRAVSELQSAKSSKEDSYFQLAGIVQTLWKRII